ncbi:MAG: aminopeptidase P family protein [Anaerolineae bacterium]|nr:aminopeptidase P family protein [Anaerolineae bacterium]
MPQNNPPSMTPDEKIAALRRSMRVHGIDAWIVPTADPHQSEYIADRWKTRAWLSGFTGSAGTLVVAQDAAGLWTDARYHIRAAQDLAGTSIKLFRDKLPGVPTYIDWLAAELTPGAAVGYDGAVMSVGEAKKLSRSLGGKGVVFRHDLDLAEEIWPDRPDLPDGPLVLHETRFSGETRASKLARVRQLMEAQGAQVLLMAALDEIAWTLNIRGSDIAFNPLALSFAVITADEVRLFVDPRKLSPEVHDELTADGVIFAPYDGIEGFLQELLAGATVLIDPDKTSYGLARAIPPSCTVKEAAGIPRALKAVKNATQLAGIRDAHVRDGVAMVRWLRWLDGAVAGGAQTEVTVAGKLAEFRSQTAHYQGLSFGTIAGYRANSAIGHYSPQPETTPTLEPAGLLVIDSGAQYLDATTDITRTVSLGAPTPEEQHAFTRVLQSQIRLATTRFPRGATGVQLDALAREPLWREGWQCRHGIGHGVGHYLGVHEGPPRFSPTGTAVIQPGMVLTIEPGVYFEGRFGIRIENMVIVVADGGDEFGDFCSFETVTRCPIDLTLVEPSLLSDQEIAWLDDYHRCVYDTLAPHLDADEQEWLRLATRRLA